MKQQILNSLLEEAGMPVSGNKLAEKLGISRVMVHKYIDTLRREGYEIKAQERRGYCLEWPLSEINPVRVTRLLSGEFGQPIIWQPLVGSTQEQLLTMVGSGLASNGQVLVARQQTEGRGRRGRAWLAEPGGLWFSIFIRTDLPMLKIARLSLVFSLAVVKALQPWCQEASIKWPNDIMVNGCKLGGLLLNLQGEAHEASNLVIGVGINVNSDPPELPITSKLQAVSLLQLRGEITPIDELFAAILQSMETLYNSYLEGNWGNIIKEYRQHCSHLGQTITVHQGEQMVTGINTAITWEGNLELMVAGNKVTLHNGDII